MPDIDLFGSGTVQMVTTDQDARGDYFGLFGQCIDLDAQLENWSATEEGYPITLEAYIKADYDAFAVSLGATFHDVARCGGSSPIGSVSESFAGDNEWTKLIATGTFPSETRSIDVFITAYGSTATATIYIDEVRAYPTDGKQP